MNAATGQYLKNGRLSDVISLIKILAFDNWIYHPASELDKKLQRPSGGESCWLTIAKQHPEFFRITITDDEKVALTARAIHYTGDSNNQKPLSPAETASLLNLAVTLQDCELRRRQRWIPLASLIIGLLTLTAVVATGSLF
ncbi:MAG: hypothetical protein FWD93_02195 [Coriobacteriia bacterium]|nr:hypothetical protein [Coriobacteriia bacterium]